ncbi:hypothetical protein GCM10020358_56220 [Amorphoplanes nipponensis]|nr:hypothetical protein [Actinoplanes nipponensis]
MSSNRTDQAVKEYLHELELRLTGLPVLQRRELLAEIEAHIHDERVARGVASESDLLELLERLGSPEVVAAAAYEEAGLLAPREPVLSYAGPARAAARPLPVVAPPPDSPPPAYAGPFPPASDFGRSSYPPPPVAGPPFAPPPVRKQDGGAGLRVAVAVAIAAVVVVLLGCLAGGLMLTSRSAVDQAPSAVEAPAEPPAPQLPTE